jgi:hypothetical protein
VADVLIAQGKAFHPSLRLRPEQTNLREPRATRRCFACGQYLGDIRNHPNYGPSHVGVAQSPSGTGTAYDATVTVS